jgi:hypothetical protein
VKTVMTGRLNIRQGVLDYLNSWGRFSKAMHSNGDVHQSVCELGGA